MRDHLESAWKQTGRKPAELDAYPFPEGMNKIWFWFCELHQGRDYGQHGANPLSYANIKCWADLMDAQPLPREIRVIKRIDALFLESQ